MRGIPAGADLTDLGRTVRPALERTMESVREARTEAQAFGRRETSPLRIWLEYSVPASLLTQAMATLRRHNQDISLSLRQGVKLFIINNLDVANLPDFRANSAQIFHQRISPAAKIGPQNRPFL